MERKQKILAVDDNPTNLAIIDELLDDENCVLRAAETGKEALEIAQDFRPDLILLDIMMPIMSGYEVCRQLRRNTTFRHTKIIIVSGKASTSERIQGYEAGADDYIIKPFDGDEFLAKVRVYLRLGYIEEIDQMRQEFVMTVTHEMRTPMTTAKNILSNAMEKVYGEIPPQLYEQLAIANNNMSRLGRIISNFFELSTFDAGQVDLQKRRFDLQDTIEDVVKKFRPEAASRTINFDVIASPQEFPIYADRKKLARVLTELIENAIKFTNEDGIINIWIDIHGNKIRIDVEDDGVGIPDAATEDIFNRFIQIEKHVGPGEHGTGLGLAIAKKIIELHDGRIWVGNKPGCGAVFSIEIPALNSDGAQNQKQLHSEYGTITN